MQQHPFDQTVSLAPLSTDGPVMRWKGAAHPDYWNMIGPFGGTTASVILQSILDSPQRVGDPVSLTLTYAKAIGEGEFEIVSHLVSATRTTQHWSVQLLCGPQREVAINAIAMFAVRRDVWSAPEAIMPDVPRAEECEIFTQPPAAPRWLRNYQFRFLRGSVGPARAGHSSDDSTTTLWVNDLPPRAVDFASLAAYCDVFFPRIYLRRGCVVPAGTVSFNIYFHVSTEELAQVGAVPLLCTARGLNFNGGFFDQNGQVWSPDGFLLANTQQLVWYKE